MNKTNNDKLLGMLGLAMRAGRLASGTEHVCDEIRRRGTPSDFFDDGREIPKKGMVLIANDASANTKKRVSDSCKYYNVNCRTVDISGLELSSRIGNRGLTMCVATFDSGFVRGIEKIMFAGSKD